jgi:hypothetical protein
VTGSAWGGMQQQFPFLAVERGEKGENLLVASGPSGQNGRGEGVGSRWPTMAGRVLSP